MFNVLLVDDEIHAVEGIKEAVEWDKFGIDTVYTVYNIHQATQLFNASQGIDLLICDIEMPLGSGLELLEWVKEHSPDTVSIFLTCHEDFHYAKKAIQLGSFDYLLKPVPIPELESVITRAIDKKAADNDKSLIEHYGQFWLQHQPLLVERFWTDILSRSIPSTEKGIRQAAEERNIPFSDELKFVPVLIAVRRWHKSLSKRDEKILEFALRNSAEELLLKWSGYGLLLNWSEGCLLAILSFERYEASHSQNLEQGCEEFIRSCAKYFYCDLNCYIGHSVYAYELPAMVDKLKRVDRNNVAQENLVLKWNHSLAVQTDSVVDKAAAYIKHNLDQSLTRDDVAKNVYLNADYLDRLFKKATGVSVTEYVVRERMAVAKQMLSETEMPVHAVALQVGFTNFSHFARIFRKHTDKNPLEFRQDEQK